LNDDKDASADVKTQLKETRKATLLNMAAVQLKMKDYGQVVVNCSKVLEHDGSNVKALYRRAQGYMNTAFFIEAEVDLVRARQEDPDNKDVVTLMQRLKQMRKAYDAKSAKMYGNMFKHVTPLSELEAKKSAEKAKMQTEAEEKPSGDAMEVDEASKQTEAADAMQTEAAA